MSARKQIDCAYCDNENLSSDVIALNRKIIHRKIERMLCLTCIATHFELNEDELEEMIERFKDEGCALFV